MKSFYVGLAAYVLLSFTFLGHKIQTETGEEDLLQYLNVLDRIMDREGLAGISRYCGEIGAERENAYWHRCVFTGDNAKVFQYHNLIAYYFDVPVRESGLLGKIKG